MECCVERADANRFAVSVYCSSWSRWHSPTINIFHNSCLKSIRLSPSFSPHYAILENPFVSLNGKVVYSSHPVPAVSHFSSYLVSFRGKRHIGSTIKSRDSRATGCITVSRTFYCISFPMRKHHKNKLTQPPQL